VRDVLAVGVRQVYQIPDVDLVFTKADLQDVVPHDNDPVVISLVTVGRRVHRVLVDQGSSADVMYNIRLIESGNWNEYNLNPLTRIHWRASLVPTVAVIPAPIAYI